MGGLFNGRISSGKLTHMGLSWCLHRNALALSGSMYLFSKISSVLVRSTHSKQSMEFPNS